MIHPASGLGEFPRQLGIGRRGACLSLQRVTARSRGFGVADAGTAEDHHRRMDPLFVQDAFGLEQFELQPQWPQFFLAKQVDVLVCEAVSG